MPISLRSAIEDHLGAKVTDVVTRRGGFSPGLAATLHLSDGRRVFAKAVGSLPNPKSPDIYRKEIKVASSMPNLPQVPRFLWSLDDGDWVVLLFENVEGVQPELPWRSDELVRVLSAIGDLSNLLTPSPVPLPTVSEQFGDNFSGWRQFAKLVELRGRSSLRFLHDAWCLENIQLLANLEEKWTDASVGNTLLHADLRADNLLLTKGRVLVVDWPWACIGAKWIDLVFFLPSVAMQGGPKPWELFDSHELAREADPSAVTCVLAALIGVLLYLGNKPPEPGLPTLRQFQLAQGFAALEWLKRRIKQRQVSSTAL